MKAIFKKQILLLLIATITIFSCSKDDNTSEPDMCNVNIPDAFFKAALTTNTMINTNNDSEISCAEATAFGGTIVVTNINIEDLTGIEAFTNITGLWCFDNNLTSVDVSANTALNTLLCHSNALTSLDVSNNTNLIDLRCGNNQLTSLDVSNNTLLTYLSCFYNNLTSIDISANTALTHLTCGNNQLTSIDISNNTALTLLYCSNNALTSLNVANGNNSNLEDFTASDNSNLMCIQIDDNFTAPSSWSIDVTASYSTNCGQ